MIKDITNIMGHPSIRGHRHTVDGQGEMLEVVITPYDSYQTQLENGMRECGWGVVDIVEGWHTWGDSVYIQGRKYVFRKIIGGWL